MRAALQRAWLHRGALGWSLLPVSWLYGALSGLRRALFRLGVFETQHLPVPVVVVGNVITGGAGKTPVVIAVVEHLRSRGLRPGVVSRGYGRQGTGCIEVTPQSDPRAVGDEPLLVATRCSVPVGVAADRPLAARALLAAHPDVKVLVSDDGLQHHALGRDIEIVVFDDRGAGNGWLLPAGPLREPWPRPADLVVRTAASGIEGHHVERRLGTEARRADGTQVPLQSFAGRSCVALAGIARPQAFFRMLEDAGITLARTVPLPDHDDFSGSLPDLGAEQPLLCTEKDASKLWRSHPGAWAVPLEVTIEPRFWTALDALLDPKLSSADGSQAA
ncbi:MULTISPECIES: tetraacyldisaccharide 4'-kinase [Ramlibacter]|uniref:Tetraacyldisaccharide 4'-kinase n=1 Tax=Ramlibacter pinisoli TaxID=2682844 RepID=A0A6N8IV66_9BURK|nr:MULTISPECIES: tetraacyldisaccharide 4'-kinase [Ramlibacter]MBA2960888.1 tetraacyldisaccharide 4'-kinase [Ramlibacter sp. CGMCC 1.13660]MVQ30834.1 tetraacyldisaccharide 4'-kinase [Ramlibacter pinisoli]